jgi:hypothetical protein
MRANRAVRHDVLQDCEAPTVKTDTWHVDIPAVLFHDHVSRNR